MADISIEKQDGKNKSEEQKASDALSQEFSVRKTTSTVVDSANPSKSPNPSKIEAQAIPEIKPSIVEGKQLNSPKAESKPEQTKVEPNTEKKDASKPEATATTAKDGAAAPANKDVKPVKIEDNPSGDTAPRTPEERKAAEKVYFNHLFNSKNFKLDQLQQGEGPEQVLIRMNAENKLGKIPWTYEQIHMEARRISHRDLGHDGAYKIGDQPERWSNKEITDRVEKTLNKTRGIDVSRWDNDIDWKQVAASGVEFAFLKATGSKRDGTTIVDPKFEQNRENATANGVKLGYYHFFRPDASMQAQIELFAKTVGKTDNRLPVVMDVEEDETKPMWKTAPDGHEYTSAERVKIINEFCDGVKKMLGPDTRIALYMNPRFARENLGTDNSSLKKYELWLANWKVPEMNVPAPWKKAQFWQYAGDTGKVAGIERNGGADLDLVTDDAFLQAPRKRKR